MKKLLLIVVLIAGLVSCGPLHRVVYRYDITYTIDGHTYTNSDTLHMSNLCVPIAVSKIQYGNNIVSVEAHPSEIWHESRTIYNGPLDCKVEKFTYKLIRKYDASRWTGQEVE